MSSIRIWHTYLGILIAPSVLFFALTGSLQLFGLHEAHDGYEPPILIEKLSTLHKDQVFAQKPHDQDRRDEGRAETDEHEAPSPLNVTLLKCYFLLVALALTTSTLLGLWMGLRTRRSRAVWWLLAAGTAIPAVLAFL
jgi:hypothetical protein